MPVTLRQHFEGQLQDLGQEILRMGSFVVEMLHLSMEAMVNQDVELANRVIAMDDEADDMDLRIEGECMRLLALQQPMSKDLRIIGTALKIITDLERIGDFSVDIAKTARRLADEEYFKPLTHLGQMASTGERMVRNSVQAFAKQDLELVREVLQDDDIIDDLYDELFTELLEAMERDPSLIRQAVWFLHVARFLERTGDHAVNVAERVNYIETGKLEALKAAHAPTS